MTKNIINENYSPIAIFAYKRIDHLKKTINSLKKNPESKLSDLYIFSDNYKIKDDKETVLKLREYLKTIDGFKSVKIILREENYGLSKSIISGINYCLEREKTIIVIEDDMITSKYFLDFMNKGLKKFESVNEVISIHGWTFPTKRKLPNVFFLQGADCWGWATWKEQWKIFNADGKDLLNKLKSRKLIKKFNLDGNFNYLKMLENQINGKNDSWAIRWHASAFLAEKLTLYPSRSLIKNIGKDGSGTHCDNDSSYESELTKSKIIIDNDLLIKVDKLSYKAMVKFYANVNGSYFRRIINYLRRILKGIKKSIKYKNFTLW